MAVVTFGTAPNTFDIDFLTISNVSNPVSGFGIVSHNFGIGKEAICNICWEKFELNLGVEVTGADPGYGTDLCLIGEMMTACPITWFEAAQFINWLNTSKGAQAAYKFTGTQGTSDYTFALWDDSEAWGGANRYRHKDSVYFLPTEDEWVKAGYWNGTSLQTWATVGDVHPTQAGWNFRCCGQDPCRNDFACSVANHGWVSDPHGPWPVNQGTVELNGTIGMMGDAWEWCESPFDDIFDLQSIRTVRGGNWNHYHRHSGTAGVNDGKSTARMNHAPGLDDHTTGFRVASKL